MSTMQFGIYASADADASSKETIGFADSKELAANSTDALELLLLKIFEQKY